MNIQDDNVVADDKAISASQASDGPACADDKQGAPVGVAEAPSVEPPVATKKKIVKKVVAFEEPRPSTDISDPLFFARLNVIHKKTQQEARRSKLSSLAII